VSPTPAATQGAEAGAARGSGSGDGSAPRHVAIIMDGNGRWAERRGLPRAAGHRAGAEAVRKTLRAAGEAGVEVLTLYAFSSENWRRSEEEVSDLKGLLAYYVDKELDAIHREGVRLRLIGDPSPFGRQLVERLDRALDRTSGNDRMTLVVALNYGARTEIAAAARSLANEVAEGQRTPESIDEQAFGAALDTAGLPELDLLIRTSGEQRLSNFLLWQAAYAELLFVDTLWPDFDAAAFQDALAQFASRQRRFGGR
jgi:undecaprenyl diphosphate synthase